MHFHFYLKIKFKESISQKPITFLPYLLCFSFFINSSLKEGNKLILYDFIVPNWPLFSCKFYIFGSFTLVFSFFRVILLLLLLLLLLVLLVVLFLLLLYAGFIVWYIFLIIKLFLSQFLCFFLTFTLLILSPSYKGKGAWASSWVFRQQHCISSSSCLDKKKIYLIK